MRTLIIADVHANLAALEAVLDHAKGTFDTVWCLGDIVGYGPDPNECVRRLRELDELVCLSGNHDHAAIGKINLNSFNPVAATALRWTQSMLLPESCDYLEGLPSIQLINDMTLVHGSPRHPVWEYISDINLAEQNFTHFTSSICLVGHTHIARVFHHDGHSCQEQVVRTGKQLGLSSGRYILNPGGVGQPRDNNPWAAYALLDLATVSWKQQRVPYNISKTQERMRAHGLPDMLIERLDFGS